MTDRDQQKLYSDEWKFNPPKPAPGPWTCRSFKVIYGPTRGETEYVIHSSEGKCVATCDDRVDADFIVSLEERLQVALRGREVLRDHLSHAIKERNDLRTRYRFFEWIRKLFS